MTTLTYNPNEVPEGELTAAEQESLAIGEKAMSAQEELLAGKFRDAEELEQAYMELQKKFSSRDPEPETEETTVEEPTTEEKEDSIDTSFLDTLWEESQEEFSQETLEKLSNMDPSDLAQMYLDYRSQQGEPERQELSAENVTTLQSIVGGEQQYADMLSWASQNMSEQEIDMYDAVMDRGDPTACFFAVQALAYRFQDANGVDGQLLTGRTASEKADVFRSQAEVVRAMADPRYDIDPAYRQDVYAKLERSDLDY
jgi:hypothetical protein